VSCRRIGAAHVEPIAEPVADELQREHCRRERGARRQHEVGCDEQELPALVEHRAPRRRRRRYAEAEERQARLRDDRARHAERRLDEQRGQREWIQCCGFSFHPLRE